LEGTRKARKVVNKTHCNKAAEKRLESKLLKETCLKYAELKESKEMTAEEVCIQVALNNNLSPSRAPKPFTVKKFVREDRAGESPGKRGRKFKAGSESQQRNSDDRGVKLGKHLPGRWLRMPVQELGASLITPS